MSFYALVLVSVGSSGSKLKGVDVWSKVFKVRVCVRVWRAERWRRQSGPLGHRKGKRENCWDCRGGAGWRLTFGPISPFSAESSRESGTAEIAAPLLAADGGNAARRARRRLFVVPIPPLTPKISCFWTSDGVKREESLSLGLISATPVALR